MRAPLDLQVFSRNQPVRRLSRDDCDALGYSPPLVLTVREHRWIFGPWRPSKHLAVCRGTEVVWTGTRTELESYGVPFDPPTPAL